MLKWSIVNCTAGEGKTDAQLLLRMALHDNILYNNKT